MVDYLFARPARQKGIDQLRKVIAIAAFKDCGNGNVDFAQPFAERGEILELERHLHERIARIGVKARRRKDQFWIERDRSIQRPFANFYMFLARRSGRDAKIVDVRERFLARARISGKLMDRRESNSFVVRDNRFRAISMVGVEIPNRNPISSILERVECGDGDIAEITKSNRAIEIG